jgi:hypothetical protein
MKEVNMISRKRLTQLVAEFRGEQAGANYEQQRAEWWGQVTFEITPGWIGLRPVRQPGAEMG